MLVEYTGRMLRDGKAAIAADVADVFARLGCTPETWGVRMSKLAGGRLLGRVCGGESAGASLRSRMLRVEAAYFIRAANISAFQSPFFLASCASANGVLFATSQRSA